MGPKGALWLELTLGDSHESFAALSDRLCREFGAVLTERMDGRDKEYRWLDFEGTSLLLMRKVSLGTALGGRAPEDVALLLRLAEAFGAPTVGWRWGPYRCVRWMTRLARPNTSR